MSSSNISAYVADYKKSYAAFTAATAYVENACRSELSSNGILANVTSRTKAANRLEGKLWGWNDGKDFKSIDEIEEAIVDLSGVRVTVYFPSQVEEVVAKFRSLFSDAELDIVKREDKTLTAQQLLSKFANDKAMTKLDTTPTRLGDSAGAYQHQYGGYRAVHIRFTLNKNRISCGSNVFLGQERLLKVEIQIQTQLMHPWSEVNHDLAYKTLSGKLSTEEEQLLDCLNGIAKLGELVLVQLKKAVDFRISMANSSLPQHPGLPITFADMLIKL